MNKPELQKREILKQLYFSDSLSCTELSEQIKKSIPLTTKLVDELLQDGIILESGQAPSTGGRRPVTFSITPGVWYILSVAMDQLVTKLAIMDMQNRIIGEVREVKLPLTNNPQALTQLITEIDSFLSNSPISKDKIAGVGIGMPGFVDIIKGVNYSFLLAGEKNIKTLISEKIGLPVFIDNDSSLIALAELRFGKARNRSNAMVINFGWGVGLGLILHEQLFRGHNGFAGEFSHLSLFQNGKICSCGNTGCLETETSLLFIIEKAKEGLHNGRLSTLNLEDFNDGERIIEQLAQAAQNGDQFAIELFSETAYHIGRGAAILIHLLNPEVIILSGRGAAAGFILQAPIQQAVNEHCIHRLAAGTSIEISSLAEAAELIGAACLVMENIDKVLIPEDLRLKSIKAA